MALTVVIGASACTKSAIAPLDPTRTAATTAPALLSVSPAAGMTGVDPTKPVVLTFNMSMMSGMEMLVVVHVGSVTGAQVAGTATWSTDRRTMTFSPAAPLKPMTTYFVHLSPSLLGANGKTIDRAQCAKIGGQGVSAGMMPSTGTGGKMGSTSGGMVNGSWGPGMMGAGWKATDGTFGMVFSFTTA